MTLIVGGVGALVLVYCSAYFKTSARGLGRFGGVFVAFAGAMLGLVTADDMLLLFVFWELTTVTSYLLIGHYAERKASRRAAMQAIVITTAGGLAMLVGHRAAGRGGGHLPAVRGHRRTRRRAPPRSTVAIVCLLAGAVTKSALIPFHFWLPAAMAAPTPGQRVPARGGHGEGRRLPRRPVRARRTRRTRRGSWIVVVLGCGTMLLGGYRALRQHDLKLILAFGTVSQLGPDHRCWSGWARGRPRSPGLAMLGAHAMFKAALFLVVGVVDAATGTRDLRRLSGRRPRAAADRARGRAGDGVDDRAAPVRRVRRQGGGARGARAPGRHAAGMIVLVAVVGRLGAHGRVRAAAVVGGVRDEARRRARPRSTRVDGAGHLDRTRPRHDEARARAPITPPVAAAGVAGDDPRACSGWPSRCCRSWASTCCAPYADTYPEGEPGHLVLWAGFTPTFVLTLGDPAERRAAVRRPGPGRALAVAPRTAGPRPTGCTGGSCGASTTSRPTSPRSPSAVRCRCTSA